MDFPIGSAGELAYLFFTFDHHGQSGGLHPTNRGQEEAPITGIEGRHGPSAIDADQPVGFAAAAGGIGQALHLGVAA